MRTTGEIQKPFRGAYRGFGLSGLFDFSGFFGSAQQEKQDKPNKQHKPACPRASSLENALIESFNGRFRDECLNAQVFVSLHDARRKVEAWRIDYNQHCPRSSLGHLTPNEFAGQRQALQTVKEAVCSS